MKISSAAGGLALAALAFVLGVWVAGGFPDVGGGDSSTRLTAILHMPDPNTRAGELVDFFASVNPNEVYALREVMKAERDHVDEVAEVLFAAWWARFDPQSALAGRMSPHWSGRHPWIRTVVGEWTRRGSENALQAVSQMNKESIEKRQVAVLALIRGWFESDGSDPELLLPVILDLDQVKARGDAINVFLTTMMDARSVNATQQFVETMPDLGYGFKTEFFGRFVGNLSSRDPAHAYAWAQKHADGPHGKNLLRHLSARWGYEDGPSAMEWVVTLPPGDRKAVLVERTWRSFSLRDREGARAWMAEQEPTPALEPAYTLYLVSTAKEAPEEALALAEVHLRDPARRIKVQKAALRAWKKTDPAAAHAWLEGADLSPEARAAILEPPRKLDRRRPRAD